jgi:hypothetical protein
VNTNKLLQGKQPMGKGKKMKSDQSKCWRDLATPASNYK